MPTLDTRHIALVAIGAVTTLGQTIVTKLTG